MIYGFLTVISAVQIPVLSRLVDNLNLSVEQNIPIKVFWGCGLVRPENNACNWLKNLFYVWIWQIDLFLDLHTIAVTVTWQCTSFLRLLTFNSDLFTFNTDLCILLEQEYWACPNNLDCLYNFFICCLHFPFVNKLLFVSWYSCSRNQFCILTKVNWIFWIGVSTFWFLQYISISSTYCNMLT